MISLTQFQIFTFSNLIERRCITVKMCFTSGEQNHHRCLALGKWVMKLYKEKDKLAALSPISVITTVMTAIIFKGLFWSVWNWALIIQLPLGVALLHVWELPYFLSIMYTVGLDYFISVVCTASSYEWHREQAFLSQTKSQCPLQK